MHACVYGYISFLGTACLLSPTRAFRRARMGSVGCGFTECGPTHVLMHACSLPPLQASEAALSQLSITHGHHKRLHGGSSSSVLDQARHVQYEAGQELRALALQGMRQGEESEEEG